jgi:hypothetical protein
MTTYTADIKPKFRPQDIGCMAPRHVLLADQGWMCNAAAGFGFADHGNARHVFERLSDGSMPTDAPWSQAWLDAYQSWIDGGFQR